MGIAFVAASAYYYELLIENFQEIDNDLDRIDQLRKKILFTDDLDLIKIGIAEIDGIHNGIKKYLPGLLVNFNGVIIISLLNMTFFQQHVVTFIFTHKLGRFHAFPTILHVTDTILALSSLYVIAYVRSNILVNLSDPSLTENERLFRFLDNLIVNKDQQLQYFFSV